MRPAFLVLIAFTAALTASSALFASVPAPTVNDRVATIDANQTASAGVPIGELDRALASVPSDQRASLAWLIKHMPDADRDTLDAAFLLAHVDGAYSAWKSAPWSAMVDEETFRDAILPYASVSETRELWLPTLRATCLPLIVGAKSPGEAAVLLNQKLFPAVQVKYSTKRARADQSPSESIASGLASCTGLSVLLIDACRSVGVPARFVGVPMWTDGSGNHSWVEIWDGAQWRYTGAAEPSGDKLDEGWFGGRASGQNRSKPEHAIYAVTWRDTGVEFPMVFDASRPRASAVDVTDRYAGKAATVGEGMKLMRVTVRDPGTNLRLSRPVEIRDAAGKSILASGTTKDERFDLNDHLELVVPIVGPQSYWVNGASIAEIKLVKSGDAVVEVTLTAPTEAMSAPGAVGDERATTDDARVDAVEPIREMQLFLRKGSVAELVAQPFAATPIDRGDVDRVATILRKDYATEVRKLQKNEFESKVLIADDGTKMPFWYAVYGEKPKSGRSLYISMHGGGGAPAQVNDQQWENQKKLYKPTEGVYVAPRAPTDTWNLWHQGHIDTLFAELIRDMIVFEDVDPNKVYFMGYSAGGDGVYQLAPRMADSLAAAAMMAGHPNETRPDSLRNLPFTLHMGGEDKAFTRNDIARRWKTMLAELAANDPGGYPNEVVIHEGKGHWMDREDAVAVPWMAKFTRDLRPTKIIWLQDDVTSSRFYWLANPAPKAGQRVVATRDGQTVTVDEASGVDELVVRFDDSMVDLSKAVTVKAGAALGGGVLFDGILPRSIGVMAKTLVERGDPSGIFSAEIQVKMPTKSGT
jgi:poly(3-hydroxybutyrate) depolymerase